ncbi:pirin family protein [Gloeocapsa sp. PCC 73106]|uniref:pirin family protein n=1 Tax=Gloeocapsa sp. PCC 73106 TaxID=102232 RepID=UPI0002ACEF31|nr:pirin family protein [Gloeocapsa sp. PCC 73106]ELR96286.1 Pirin-related protein [Gloeocapsa sp. PCC 73106]
MITIRPAQARGTANFGWLDTKHTFSFGSYYDPQYLGFKTLRVINEDKIQPSQGFGTHSHRDMEIITYVLDGELEHKDSIGNGSIIRPGDIQRMSAGTGIAHSEFNASNTAPVHLLQIWILPEISGIEPSYEQKYFAPEEKQGKFKLVGSRDGRDNSVTIHQDVNLYVATLDQDEQVKYCVGDRRSVWMQIARGKVEMNEQILNAGDGVAIEEDKEICWKAIALKSEILLFDLG